MVAYFLVCLISIGSEFIFWNFICGNSLKDLHFSARNLEADLVTDQGPPGNDICMENLHGSTSLRSTLTNEQL